MPHRPEAVGTPLRPHLQHPQVDAELDPRFAVVPIDQPYVELPRFIGPLLKDFAQISAHISSMHLQAAVGGARARILTQTIRDEGLLARTLLVWSCMSPVHAAAIVNPDLSAVHSAPSSPVSMCPCGMTLSAPQHWALAGGSNPGGDGANVSWRSRNGITEPVSFLKRTGRRCHLSGSCSPVAAIRAPCAEKRTRNWSFRSPSGEPRCRWFRLASPGGQRWPVTHAATS